MLKFWKLLVVSGLLLFEAGCWDSVELNKRAIVSGVSIDKGLTEDKKYSVSFQVIVADEITGKNSRGNAPVALYKGSGRSIYEALGNASRQSARILSLGHSKVIIISEDLAREGIRDLMDIFERESEMRLSTLVFVSRGQRAEDILSVMTIFGKIPANDLVQKLETGNRSFGYNFRIEVDDVIRGILAKEAGAIINGVIVKGDPEAGETKANLEGIKPKAILKNAGLAVFKQDKLEAFQDGPEGMGLSLIHNKQKEYPLFLELGKNESATFGMFKVHTSVRANAKDPEHPVIYISTQQQATLKEYNGSLDISKSSVLRNWEKLLSEETKKEIDAAVKEAMRLNSDYIRFNESVNRVNPKGWKRVKDRWESIFPRCEVHIKVNTLIRHTEMRTRSLRSSEEGEE
ncbi:Ger(x)C family spore germination protein [Paenibacillus sophorae]|uniref:Ger(X)C family spore germination protein n=1 Tax=Paenibacillus sophorae TaxID=1333845 RepID=A0ABX8H5P9_9BACL|nr:Ger(x)C family spore germination protein [Paenibacillus sophorae]QWU13483.1 Ger(x)C family spore germination protein [Paenibacillus sophorae]